MKKILMTQESKIELEKKLDYLKCVRRKEVAEKLKDALSFGDLSENSEYDTARDEQGFLETEIFNLAERLSNSEIINEDDDDNLTNVVKFGKTFDILFMDTNEIINLKMVSVVESGVGESSVLTKISNECPLGIAIWEHEEGDIVKVKSPGGIYEAKILKIYEN